MDLRTFYVKITEEDRQQLLDKLSEVAKQFYAEEVPAKEDKCFFCQYKTACMEQEQEGLNEKEE